MVEGIKIRRKRGISIVPMTLSLILLLTSCSSPVTRGKWNRDPAISPGNEPGKLLSQPDESNGFSDEFRNSLLGFSWNIFRESSQNEGNILISPASVYLALGMTYNGADTETRQAMEEVLNASGLSMEEFNAACRDYISLLHATGDKTELSIGNSIWYRDTFHADKDFLKKNKDVFGAEVRSLDFGKPEAAATINQWVKEETKNTIDKMVDQIDMDTVMYLINAVYFKSEWQVPFSANDTRDAEFYRPDGDKTVPFMNQNGEMAYLAKDGIQGVVLPYDDGRFQFFALLPKEGEDVRSFIREQNGLNIHDYLLSMEKEYLHLALPKFETRFEDSMKDELTGLGMGIAFDAGSADFSLMSDTHKKILYINEVKHKPFCRVDELGTEASAVTSVEMRLTGAPLEPNIQVIFDRPFVYGIADTVTGAPLFLGIMEDPGNRAGQ